MQNDLEELSGTLKKMSAKEGLQHVANRFGKEAIFSTSFGIEDQVVTHLIASQKLPISIFTLDTGRLFTETYSTWSRTTDVFQLNIDTFYPDAFALQKFVTANGPNSFYESVDNRKQCCFIRKVEPLKRALKGKQIWVTGIRAEQSANRQSDAIIEWDEANNIIKFHPLLHWTFDEVKAYIQNNNVPYNSLHDKGFVSIGCSPCTRAIRTGEDFRAGRWWWEDNSKKECGLHVHANPVTEK